MRRPISATVRPTVTHVLKEQDFPAHWTNGERVRFARDFYLFSEMVNLGRHRGRIKLIPPGLYVWGRHALRPADFELKPERIDACARYQRLLGMQLLAIEMDSALKSTIPDRLDHSNPEVRNLSIVVWQLRNAFAHDPLSPVWRVNDPKYQMVFHVLSMPPLDLKLLNGQSVQRRHFGGPLALVKLVDLTLGLIEPSSQPTEITSGLDVPGTQRR